MNRSSGRAVCGVGAVCAKALRRESVLEDGGQRIWTVEGRETRGVGSVEAHAGAGRVWN